MIAFLRNYNSNAHNIVTAGAPNIYTVAVVAVVDDDDVLSVVLTLTARLMYRHIPSLEVFVDFDKEDLVHSTCSGGVIFFRKSTIFS